MATSADFKAIVDELTEEYGKQPTPKQLVAACGGKDLLSLADALAILSDLCTQPVTKKRKDAPKAAVKAKSSPSAALPEEPVAPEEVKDEKAASMKEPMEVDTLDGKVPTEEEMAMWKMFEQTQPEQDFQPAAAVALERGNSQRFGII